MPDSRLGEDFFQADFPPSPLPSVWCQAWHSRERVWEEKWPQHFVASGLFIWLSWSGVAGETKNCLNKQGKARPVPLLLVQNEKHLVLVCGKPSVPVGRGTGLEAGLGLWAEEADTGLVADCLPWLEMDGGCNSSPLGCGMGHTWPGEQEGWSQLLRARWCCFPALCPHGSLIALTQVRL